MALASNALTTTAAVDAELADLTTTTANVERAINTVSEAIAQHVNRTLHYEAGITQDAQGDGTRLLLLDRYPVVSVSSVTIEGETATASTYQIASAESGLLERVDGEQRSTWPRMHRPAITVTYTAGYVTPKQAADAVGTRNLPYDLEDVAISAAARYYRARFDNPRKDPNLAELWIGGNTRARFLERDDLFTAEEKAILAKYRALRV